MSGATLLVVHHTRKSESADFVDSVSGTQGVAGSADFVLVLSRKRHENNALLSVTGRDIPEGEYALAGDQGLWQLDGDTLAAARQTAHTRRETGRLGDRALEVLAFVNGRKETRRADVAQALGLDPKRASETLSRLAETGRIRKAARGVYAPLETCADSADNAGQSLIPLNLSCADSATVVKSPQLSAQMSAQSPHLVRTKNRRVTRQNRTIRIVRTNLQARTTHRCPCQTSKTFSAAGLSTTSKHGRTSGVHHMPTVWPAGALHHRVLPHLH